MGQPVVHFEVIGKDADKLQSYYAELFGWEMNADNAGDGGGVCSAARAMGGTPFDRRHPPGDGAPPPGRGARGRPATRGDAGERGGRAAPARSGWASVVRD